MRTLLPDPEAGRIEGGSAAAKISHGGIGGHSPRSSWTTSPSSRCGAGDVWYTANTAILAERRRRLIDDPARFDGVTPLGVHEHVWRHTRFGDEYATVTVDLTPARNKTGPVKLLDMAQGRSKAVFKQRLRA